MVNKIIISGNIAGSGKDTMADYLVRKYGYNKLFFADGIYNIARNLFGMEGKNRALLQSIGEKMREIEPLVWINHEMKKVAKLISDEQKVVISDLRRENEYIRAVEEGFLPIRVVCDRDVAIKRIVERDGFCDESLLDNESENGTRSIPMLQIYNNGTVKELFENIDKLVEQDFTGYIKELQDNLKMDRYC